MSFLTWQCLQPLFVPLCSPNCLSFVELLFERAAERNSPNFQRSAAYNFLRRAVPNDYPSLQRVAGRRLTPLRLYVMYTDVQEARVDELILAHSILLLT
jgi:hypothetical protein